MKVKDLLKKLHYIGGMSIVAKLGISGIEIPIKKDEPNKDDNETINGIVIDENKITIYLKY